MQGFDTDFIPSIDEPTFETGYFGAPDDEIDGEPVLVSFCPLCGTVTADGATWDRGTGESDDGRALSRLSASWTYAYAWQSDHGPDAFYDAGRTRTEASTP